MCIKNSMSERFMARISWLVLMALCSISTITLRAEDCQTTYPTDKLAQCNCECNNTFRSDATACQGTVKEKNQCVMLAAIKNGQCQKGCSAANPKNGPLNVINANYE